MKLDARHETWPVAGTFTISRGAYTSIEVVVRRGREKLHYINPVPIAEIYDRWIGKYERGRLRALAELRRVLEDDQENCDE